MTILEFSIFEIFSITICLPLVSNQESESLVASGTRFSSPGKKFKLGAAAAARMTVTTTTTPIVSMNQWNGHILLTSVLKLMDGNSLPETTLVIKKHHLSQRLAQLFVAKDHKIIIGTDSYVMCGQAQILDIAGQSHMNTIISYQSHEDNPLYKKAELRNTQYCTRKIIWSSALTQFLSPGAIIAESQNILKLSASPFYSQIPPQFL